MFKGKLNIKMDHKHFLNALLEWFDTQKDCNVFFLCPDSENPEKKLQIGAHTNILAMASEYFNAMFYGTMATKNPENPIEISTVYLPFKLLLSFIYGRKVKFDTIEIARDFYEAADFYMCKDAIEYGKRQFFKMLKPKNLITCYEIGHIYNNERLKDAAWKLIRFDEKILERQKFLEASPEIVVDLFQKQESLNVGSDKEFVVALEHYIAHNKALDPDIAAKIRPAIQSISFLTLTPDVIRATTLLTDTEKAEILAKKESKQDSFPMPEGFSKCIVSRESTHAPTRWSLNYKDSSENDESSEMDTDSESEIIFDLISKDFGERNQI
ncbi:kelch repeat and BTB domain-containing protein 8-like [Culicoides brevitarsis]|uniref:kelch repeat and BTB domain-containing protein 8-like n=1 Tax=Culicoides brevitarsis TaxID=469753 RepID=UPI00307B1477